MMKNRLLALLLSLCMMASTCACALAEGDDIRSEQVESSVPELETGVIDLEPEGDAEDGAEASAEEAGEDSVPADGFDIAEDMDAAAKGQTPAGGLAAVVGADNALYDDSGVVLREDVTEGTILYVEAFLTEGLLHVCFAAEGAAAWGWMDAAALSLLTDEASEAYIASARANADAVWLNDAVPLSAIAATEGAAEAAPKALTLNAERIELAVGESFALAATTDGAVEWAVENAAVASVSTTGVVTALTPGETVVFAVTASDLATCTVVVSEKPAEATYPKAIRFTASELTLGVGQTTDTLCTILNEADQAVDVDAVYQSGKPKYVSVDADGAVKALKKGSAMITATFDGMTATCQVTVLKAPTKLTVSPATLVLGVGQTGVFSYTLPKNTAGAVRWESSNPAVAEIDPLTGEVTARSAGTAQLTAVTHNKKHKEAKLTVLSAPESVSFGVDALSMGVGEHMTLKAAVNDGAWGEVSYTSSDSAVAKVDGDTLIGVSVGTAQITATAYNGVSTECEVTVNPAPTYVKLPYSTLILGLKDSVRLRPDAGGITDLFLYKSSKPKYVSVDSDGVVKALKKGTAYITVSTFNGLTFTLKVEVLKAPSTVTAVPTSHTMGVGERFTMGYALPSKSGGSVSFSSSDETILKVDPETGEVTARACGTADVIVRTYNDHTARCRVEVYGAPTEISLEYNLIEVAVEESCLLKPVLSSGSRSSLTYESEDPSVAVVSDDGVVTGVGRGVTVVYVRTSVPEVYAEAFVTVWDAPASVRLETTVMNKTVNESFKLNPIIPNGTRTTFTFTSDNEKVAVVDDMGYVQTLSGGQATITVSTHNGKTATLTLTVLDPWYPEALTLLSEDPELDVGDTFQVYYSVTPETSSADLMWDSSNPGVARVDDDGLITAVSGGHATITAVSLKNNDLKISIYVTVRSGGLTTEIPERTTDVNGIKRNLEKIDAIRRSAIYEIDRLASNGTISSADASKRRSIVNAIFANYAFPWKTLSLQKYWKAANSEGGVKDFKPDRVYYGLPYISGSGENRHYDVSLALRENRYYDSGKGYYILNQNNLKSGKYVGNDCSGLCNVSIWGTSSSRASDRTKDIASSKYYKTISNTKDLRPGDLICKGGSHVVMFLYYTNSERTQIMMIENGGAEPGTNTVHCDIYDLSYYTSRGYKGRRLATLDD